MPRPPIFHTPHAQRLAVAIVMLFLFALSLTLGWVITGAKTPQLPPILQPQPDRPAASLPVNDVSPRTS